MNKLTIRTTNDYAFSYHTITGWTEEDWKTIKETPDGLLEEWIIHQLDERNDGIGTCWYCGYGLYRIHIRQGECVIVKTGYGCD